MNRLITSSLNHENVSLLFGFPRKLMTAREREIVEWIVKYTSRHGQPPTVQRLEDEFVTFVPINEVAPLTDVYEQTLKRKRNLYAREFILGVEDDLKKGADPLPFVKQLMDDINGGDDSVVFYTKMDRSIYHRVAESIPFEVPEIDRETGGISPGDLTYVVGRLGSGKTTFMTWEIASWLKADRRILMASNENRAEDIVAKIDSFVGGWNPNKKRTMAWKPDELRRIRTVSHIARGMTGEVIIPNKPVPTVEEVQGLVQIYHPDIVVIDGVYLMTGSKANSHWERITDISRDLKRLAESEKVPVFGVHQASRAAADKRMTITELAYSDALAQDADLVLAINKEEDESIFVECIKNRWGRSKWGFFLEFFWDPMSVRVSRPELAMAEED